MRFHHIDYNKILERINLTDYLPIYFKVTLLLLP